MNEDRVLAQVRELEAVITQLDRVRNDVSGFRITDYEDAGGGKWAGQKRKSFVSALDDAKADFARIDQQISDAISDCKNKQRHLAFSINPIEHPQQSITAVAIALS